MRYTIRHFDLPLLTFEANMDSADTDLHIIKVYEENRSFLPLNLTVSADGVERWLRHRTIPKNRAYVDALLSKVGLSLNRPLGIIAANKGHSLNDCFWVDAERERIANKVAEGLAKDSEYTGARNDAVKLAWDYGNAVRFVPADELETIQSDYSMGKERFVFATCNGDPIYVYDKKIYTCCHGTRKIKDELMAENFAAFLDLID